MKVYPYLSSAIARVIEALRAERGMTKSSLADFACLERRYLRDIERELKKPTVNAIYSICEALRVQPEDFFRRVSEEIEKRKNSERRVASINKAMSAKAQSDEEKV
ncbi:helix-turn-helix domain-containing protein [Desulfovibrio intestinalis]|uniref:Transcriptional regulator with XRE-family HTH domain n=1 Tax=Desulfovibrio intestinalis TaxID=58621 RepID=A0A7W8BXV7_9BACT|nr:helix-turn-helix transcriptional regulator [Desulfovibrio intestinalis]MBB5141955.1 transcriptional regulator with XRE-family HTH domain [Desulfovibrio intestinalis]